MTDGQEEDEMFVSVPISVGKARPGLVFTQHDTVFLLAAHIAKGSLLTADEVETVVAKARKIENMTDE